MTVIGHSEVLKRAVRWISEQRRERPKARLNELLSEAGPRFNLSPGDQEGLARLLRENDAAGDAASSEG